MKTARGSRQDVRIDLHVHTGRYSACAEAVAPGRIALRARATGLHGVVLTDHDILWEVEELDVLRQTSNGVALYRGVECSTRDGHLVLIGLDDAGTIHRGLDLESGARLARQAGAAVILAHPYRDHDPDSLCLEQIDAVEVGSTSFTLGEAERAEGLAHRLGKPRVASSDAHALSRIGWAWTSFPSMPADERELAEMIRTGRGEPVIPRAFPG